MRKKSASDKATPTLARKKKPTARSAALTTTLAENTVQITNVDAGESIPLSFAAQVGCANNSGSALTLIVSCDGATVTPGSMLVASGTALPPSPFTITHAAPGTGHRMSAVLRDPTTGQLFASDTVDPVDVVDPVTAPLTITPTATPSIQDGLPALDPALALSGTIGAPAPGDAVILMVEQDAATAIAGPAAGGAAARRGARHQKVFLVEKVTPTAGGIAWAHPAFTPAQRPRRGDHIRVMLVRRKLVKAIVRGIFD